MGTDIKFTDGKISSKTGFQGSIATYQISVPIQPGNSGGPLFDKDGSIIGLTSAGINRSLNLTENVNYAIKSIYLKNLVDVLGLDLSLPNDITISKRNLQEKIKVLSDYVTLIKIR
jgi:S1-C subfamily serine protease